jgi:type VI secretion system secreted protein Hcp
VRGAAGWAPRAGRDLQASRSARHTRRGAPGATFGRHTRRGTPGATFGRHTRRGTLASSRLLSGHHRLRALPWGNVSPGVTLAQCKSIDRPASFRLASRATSRRHDAGRSLVAIYMKLGSVAGSVTTSGYESWIALDSFRWGFSVGMTSKMAGSEATLREVVVTMRAEKASPLIVNAGFSRTVLKPSVLIKFTTTSKDKVDVFLTYELSNCVISNYAIEAQQEGHPTETLSLSFTKITETFNPRDSKLTGSPTTVTYDVTSAQTS